MRQVYLGLMVIAIADRANNEVTNSDSHLMTVKNFTHFSHRRNCLKNCIIQLISGLSTQSRHCVSIDILCVNKLRRYI